MILNAATISIHFISITNPEYYLGRPCTYASRLSKLFFQNGVNYHIFSQRAHTLKEKPSLGAVLILMNQLLIINNRHMTQIQHYTCI